MPPGHPFLFPFSFFLLFSSFSFLFCRPPFSPSLSFCSSSCRFPFVYCIAFFDFLFASLLSLVVDSVILSRCCPPPRYVRACKSAYSPCVLPSFLRSCFLFILFFFSSFPFFAFGRRLFRLFFLCGYYTSTVSSVSVSVATR